MPFTHALCNRSPFASKTLLHQGHFCTRKPFMTPESYAKNIQKQFRTRNLLLRNAFAPETLLPQKLNCKSGLGSRPPLIRITGKRTRVVIGVGRWHRNQRSWQKRLSRRSAWLRFKDFNTLTGSNLALLKWWSENEDVEMFTYLICVTSCCDPSRL